MSPDNFQACTSHLHYFESSLSLRISLQLFIMWFHFEHNLYGFVYIGDSWLQLFYLIVIYNLAPHDRYMNKLAIIRLIHHHPDGFLLCAIWYMATTCKLLAGAMVLKRGQWQPMAEGSIRRAYERDSTPSSFVLYDMASLDLGSGVFDLAIVCWWSAGNYRLSR